LDAQVKMTRSFRDVALRLCVSVSYREARDCLEKLLDSAPSCETLRQAVSAEGEMVLRSEQRERDRLLSGEAQGSAGTGPERLYMGLDGGFARKRERGKWHEVKCGSLFSDQVVTVSKHRRWRPDREHVGTFASAEAFGEQVYASAVAHGVEQASEVVVLGDGAGWIRSVQQLHFPQAKLRLDFWHVQEALGRGLRAVYRGDDPRRQQRYHTYLELIAEGRSKEAVRRLRQVRARADHGQEALDKTIGYLERNSDMMPNYRRLQSEGQVISSASAEQTVEQLVNGRFKGQHRQWRTDCGEALLALCRLKLNGRWDQYWQQRKAA
jgi:hypothetical protein